MMTLESEEWCVKSLNSRLRSKNGAALIMALLILSAFSLLTAAIVLTVQTETKISANYKYGEEAFYVANAGVQKSLDWFNTVYAPHLPTSDYDTAKVPVQYQSNNAVLAGQPGSTCNYPDSATFTSFASQFASATLQADGKNSGQYAVNATLIRTKAVRFLDTATMTTSASAIERWRIDSIGFWG